MAPMAVSMTVPMIATLLQTAALATLQAMKRQSAAAGARASMPVARRAMALTRRPMPVARAPMNDDRHCRLPRAAACGSHQVQDQQHAMTQHHAMTEQPHAMID